MIVAATERILWQLYIYANQSYGQSAHIHTT